MRRTLRVIRYSVALLCTYAFLHYLHARQREPSVPQNDVEDNLRLAAFKPSDLPPLPSWNLPPDPHVPEQTPLFIGFSRNWPLLQQAVVSYLTAGWPSRDIYVVDNSGTMLSNELGHLSLQNPSFLNYSRLREVYEVNIIRTPTLLSFAQLQNFYISTALDRNWTLFFWSHMDAVALSTAADSAPYQSLYLRAVQDLRTGTSSHDWAVRFYAYDRLALVNVSAFDKAGAWDTFMPFYGTDCDMYERLNLAGFHNPSPNIGRIFDVATVLEDLTTFYEVGQPDSTSYKGLYGNLATAMKSKHAGAERNTWQFQQRGGQNEPYHYSEEGSKLVREESVLLGRRMYRLKWGTSECRLRDQGFQQSDMWHKSTKRFFIDLVGIVSEFLSRLSRLLNVLH